MMPKMPNENFLITTQYLQNLLRDSTVYIVYITKNFYSRQSWWCRKCKLKLFHDSPCITFWAGNITTKRRSLLADLGTLLPQKRRFLWADLGTRTLPQKCRFLWANLGTLQQKSCSLSWPGNVVTTDTSLSLSRPGNVAIETKNFVDIGFFVRRK